MEKVTMGKLAGVPITMLFPLYARAVESRREKPIFTDPSAISMLGSIDFDFSVFENMQDKPSFRKKDMLTGISVRTELIDNVVNGFLSDHPEGLVVNLGCGLDSRQLRLDNGTMQWIDVDLDDVIDIRKHFFQETGRFRMLGASVLDEDWLSEIRKQDIDAVLFLAEGTLMYFEEQQVKSLLLRIADQFPGADLCFEVMGSALKGKIHPTVKCLDEQIFCPWGIDDYNSIESWDHRLKLIDYQFFIDHHKERWGWLPRVLSTVFASKKATFGHAILHMKIANEKK